MLLFIVKGLVLQATSIKANIANLMVFVELHVYSYVATLIMLFYTFIPYNIKVQIITSTNDLQPSTAVANQLPYAGNIWRGKILANLANLWQFAKFLPSKCPG